MASASGSKSPSPPISPLTLPGGDSYITARAPLDPITEHVVAEHSRPSVRTSRSGSITSISFNTHSARKSKSSSAIPPSRQRGPSPPPSRFQHHVSFDNFEAVEPTKNNSISYTLNVKHTGYQYKRRSRTFMVGIDENDYSNIALQWMLEELVDDGDEIVCLRVVDKGAKVINNSNLEAKKYQKEAQDMMDRIQAKNDINRAISIVLEFAVGKVPTTFLQMIHTYNPAMLIVGTRGRSLGGVQGLVSQRNSFSKWCLQYSPIPVVVVRPTEKRIKKKHKREADAARQEYARILRDSGVEQHETNSSAHHIDFESLNTPDGEAHAVAAALGLPGSFDPTVRPMHLPGSQPLRKVDSGNSDVTSIAQSSIAPDSRPNSPNAVMKSPKSAEAEVSGDESSDDDDEGEFEVTPGDVLLANATEETLEPEIEKKMKLHEMEVGEAAALLGPGTRKTSVGSLDSSMSGRGQGGSSEDVDPSASAQGAVPAADDEDEES